MPAAAADVRLKLETLQPTSSYKVRGAFNTVLRMVEEHGGTPPLLVTASAGNHGRALAWAVRAGGMKLTVYAPRHAPRTKLEAIAASGAVLVPCDDYDEAERRAKEHAAREGALFISPYSHPDVIAGAGTIGLEILEDWPDVDLIVVPIGGGGLISGIALAVRGVSTSTQVAGVEVEASCPFTQGLEAGRIVEIDVQPTLADGLAGNLDPDTITFDIVRREVSRDRRGQRSPTAGSHRRHRRERAAGDGRGGRRGRCGGDGRTSSTSRGKRVAIVLSGANIDQETLGNAASLKLAAVSSQLAARCFEHLLSCQHDSDSADS